MSCVVSHTPGNLLTRATARFQEKKEVEEHIVVTTHRGINLRTYMVKLSFHLGLRVANSTLVTRKFVLSESFCFSFFDDMMWIVA